MGNGSVLIIGGGTMGRGIAALCSLAGYPTSVHESDTATRSRLRGEIESSWRRAVEKGKLTEENVRAAGDRLSVAQTLTVAPDCALVLEAAPEILDVKLAVFADLDRLAPPETVLASNTSSLSIERLAAATRRPESVIGIHFFNPVASMPLVEIVRAPQTSDHTLERAVAFASDLGKQPICVADSPGFATSRLGVALGLEAMRMVEEGVASAADIDRAMELGYGHRMGPLKTSDLVGLDVRLAIASTLERELDPIRFRPPEILKSLVAGGKTGKKSGEGFYLWTGDEARVPPGQVGRRR